MSAQRFKIDFCGSVHFPFGLFFAKQKWWGGENWRLVESFDSRQQALDFYEKIKNLPEYLE